MRYSVIFFVMVMLVVSSCTEKAKEGKSQEQLNKELAIKSKLETILSNKDKMDIGAGEQLIEEISQYSNEFRSDSMTAVFLLDGAQLCGTMGKYQKAIQLLMNYTEHPKATQLDYATYLVGYEYDAHLKQPVTAEKYYRTVIERYPDSEWAKVANQSLQWLGLSDEELIKKLEEKNAGSTAP
jgi:outer membrane protein assembly factor BamD (BamD/ComL family)